MTRQDHPELWTGIASYVASTRADRTTVAVPRRLREQQAIGHRANRSSARPLDLADVCVGGTCKPRLVQTIESQARKGQLARAVEPHVPMDRPADGTWLYAPHGAVLIVASGARVVCHLRGASLAAISSQHVGRHGLDLAGYRGGAGSFAGSHWWRPLCPRTWRAEGRLRWESNHSIRAGLAVSQEMARSGPLHELGTAAQPAGSRRSQGRSTALRDGASADDASASGSAVN